MFDQLDTQTASQREAALFADFGARLSACMQTCEGLGTHLQGYAAEAVHDRESLQTLPVLRKSELMKYQQANPPFGGFVDMQSLEGQRIFMSPGPVWEPQIPGSDPWQAARALHAAGIRRGHRIHNTFSYHLTPGGFILDEGARALGCVVFPAGAGGTETQVQAIRQCGAQVYVGTPDYLQTLLDHANAEDKPLKTLERAMVSGGALFPAMRKRYEEQGVQVLQCYATADLGVIAYESATAGVVHPGMLINEGLIVEILIPGTSTPVTPGEVGEVVVTRLDPVYPLLRFATGDLSAELAEASPCGRTSMRIKGWMGRADQRVKVRGMFVDPVQLQNLPLEYSELARWRLCVSRENDRDIMTLSVTLKSVAADSHDAAQIAALSSRLEGTLKNMTNLSGKVQVVDSLPNDGVVVEDQRDYEQH
ncbi:phenylacetate--CoA ligase family protein [Granulosicoccus antarcticus]|uniref:Phenylacetate-coenzyme A ligase n=1 Tax=Granulosicoccus antarcticus IMCC3135 TaxID=1192854 RepID=A0A2Z2P545_9GAMM|nr:AMP-binding protein [Granulosicoccus antarcticus]ASJ74954.1 Phenylacetate-coenzyme A ligase [Granulosicoccus antarcticus IMCC3135]